MPHPTLQQLRPIELFAELTDEELARWTAVAELRSAKAGEILEEQGQTATGLHLLLEGQIQAFVVVNDIPEPAGMHIAPTWLGAIPTLTENPVAVRMQAYTDVLEAFVPAEPYVELALAQRPVNRRVLRDVRQVTARIGSVEQNRERLAALGTMAAGLAHELNNPAAAAKRAASEMAEALGVVNGTLSSFVYSGIERPAAQQLVELQREALAASTARTPLDALDAADAEDELTEALEAFDVPEPWRLVEPLAAAGVDREWLERVRALAGEATPAAVRWVAATITASELAAELRESTDRISGLVGAVKSYAYMDRGALVDVDLHEGLETTLVVLGHKLKHTEIKVQRRYDRTLPRAMVYGGELNQVWTNLLDNAIDALGERGTIIVRTCRDGNCAIVEIEDDGPGIPADVREHIFEPFFTTKDVGHGTGLGLQTARRIVQERHSGTLDVRSEPGRTVFRVWLPLAPAER
ncbi:MAG TPA: ATP-binding protein [Solirubrobacteraceae bacterium]|nr:ATP-binding protein [Solirubrobacteraceae bacterium]